MRATVGRLVLVAFGLSCGMGAAELGLRAIAPRHSRIWPPALDRILQPDPAHLPGVEGTARFRIGSHGLRAPPLPSGEAITMVALGGSTTECVYLDGTEAWPALLAATLTESAGRTVWVGNGGVSGLSMRHHVVQLESLLEQLPGLDVVILLAGGNDFLRYIGGRREALAWRRDTREALRVHYEAFQAPRRPSFGPFHERTELMRLLRLSRNRLRGLLAAATGQAHEDDGTGYARWRAIRASALELVDTLPPLGPALAAFEADLRRSVELARGRGVDLVLLTQPTMWAPGLPPELEELLWMGEIDDARVRGRGRYLTTAALARGMSMFNDVTRRVCAGYGLTCVDLDRLLPKDTTVFYDDMHFNEPGARRVAELVAEGLISRPLRSPPP